MIMPMWQVKKKHEQGGVISYKDALKPVCVISGSVNYTKNGISISDEALVILRDGFSIEKAFYTINKLVKGCKIRYDSRDLTGKKINEKLTW
jgi:hypothetical protein